jgi:nitrogen fixation protein NifB
MSRCFHGSEATRTSCAALEGSSKSPCRTMNASTDFSAPDSSGGVIARSILLHPCMNEKAHHQVPRLHLPVAEKCNTRCGYCERQISEDVDSVIAPGVSAAVLTPEQALAKTRAFLNQWGKGSVVGVAGPGEPLANDQTLETLRLIRVEYPEITLCVCTNGLNLPDRCAALKALGVQHISVTINGFDASIVTRIQPMVMKNGRVYTGSDAAQVLIQNQTEGLMAAVQAGMAVKVNCVVIPEINGDHVAGVARKVSDLGGHVFNPMPLIPRGRFRDMCPPDERYMGRLRSVCGEILPTFHQCKQCRADAEGIPGKEKAG